MNEEVPFLPQEEEDLLDIYDWEEFIEIELVPLLEGSPLDMERFDEEKRNPAMWEIHRLISRAIARHKLTGRIKLKKYV